MKIATIIVLTLSIVCARKLNCSDRNIISYLKDATYNFSVRLLYRVSQETEAHFVFSPLSTWLQLITLKDGARSSTRTELRKVTRYHKLECFQRTFYNILTKMHKDLEGMSRTKNIMAINKLLDVKETFKKRVRRSAATTVLLLNFYESQKAIDQINKVVTTSTNGVIRDAIDVDDFELAVFLMLQTGYFESDWMTPFNPAYTSRQTFYSEDKGAIGEVEMMTNTGYYSIADVPFLNAKVLDLPFNSHRRLSMLVILPNEGSIWDTHYNLKYTNIITIRNILRYNRRQLVNVKLPRFKIRSRIENLPELLYDMGLKRIFYPDLANFGGISNYKMYVSSMAQLVDIEVTEKGVKANTAEYIIKGNRNSTEFTANRPFAFLIVDWKTSFILFAGSYSKPSVF